MFFALSKSIVRAKIWINDVSKPSDNIKIKVKMPNSSQERSESFEAPKQDLKDIDIRVCILKMGLSEVKLV